MGADTLEACEKAPESTIAVDPVAFLVQSARTSFAAFVAAVHRPNFKHSAFSARVCRAVDQFVLDVIDGKRPVLMLTAPPQHGKSSLIARCLPPYLFGRLSGHLDAVRIASASYAHALAQRNRRDAQNIMNEPIYREIFPHTSLIGFAGVDNASEGLQIPGNGWLKGVGIGGPLTGFSVDCFAADTLIDTDHGAIRVDNLHMHAKAVKVLSRTENGELEYARIKAVGHRQATRLYRITTDAGRVLTVTGNHPVYANGGYVAASELAAGDVLVCALPEADHEKRSGLHEAARPVAQRRPVLQQVVHGACEAYGVPNLSGLRQADDVIRRETLLDVSQAAPESARSRIREATRDDLRNVWKDVCKRMESRCEPLLQRAVQERRAFAIDDGTDKPAICWRCGEVRCAREATQQGNVSICEVSDAGPRWAQVRDLCADEAVARTPYRREPASQFVLQFADALRGVSPASAPAHGHRDEIDAVRLVEIIDGPVVVYDLQVEKNANLFANGILAHNCGIIDDAVKNAQEALSEVTQARNRDWYDSVFLTRLQQRSGQVIIGTPWSAQDLLAHVRKLYKDDPNFKLLSFPALNLPDELGYDEDLPQGALVPHLHDEQKLKDTKRFLGEFWWAAMYQQTPLADFGAIFKRECVQFYRRADLPQMQVTCMSVDATFKDGDASDYVAAGVWGKTADSNVYLLDGRRERLAFMATAQAITDLRRKHPRINRIYIEEAANGAALIDMLKKHFTGLVGVPPLGSKEARAHAVSWAWQNKQVFLPHPDEAPWINAWIAEITSFPDVKNDDTVDCMSIALQQLLLRTPISAMITREILNRA